MNLLTFFTILVTATQAAIANGGKRYQLHIINNSILQIHYNSLLLCQYIEQLLQEAKVYQCFEVWMK